MEELLGKFDEFTRTVSEKIETHEVELRKVNEKLERPIVSYDKKGIQEKLGDALWEGVLRQAQSIIDSGHKYTQEIKLDPEVIMSTKSGQEIRTAMTSANTDYFGTLLFNQVQSYVFDNNWMGLFKKYVISGGASMRVPFGRNIGSHGYVRTESTNENQALVKTLSAASGSVLLNPVTFIARTLITGEAVEDSYINAVGEIQNQLFNMNLDDMQSVIINGQNSGAIDANDDYLAALGSDHPWMSMDGLRIESLADATTKIDASAYTGTTFVQQVLVAARGAMGKFGNNLVGICSPRGYAKLLGDQAFFFASYYGGAGNVARTGEMPAGGAGIRWVDSYACPDTANTGYLASASNTTGNIVIVNPNAYAIGISRNPKLEMTWDIESQCWKIVMSSRMAFGKGYVSTDNTCATLYKIS